MVFKILRNSTPTELLCLKTIGGEPWIRLEFSDLKFIGKEPSIGTEYIERCPRMD